MDDSTSWGDLIVTLQEAEEGDRRLDAIVAYHCGAAGRDAHQMMRLLIDEGSSWDLIFELLEGEIPPFTSALDAAVPGENIVCAMYSSKHDRWAAVHREPEGGEVLAWAANEVLARRTAGLKAIRERSLAEAQRRPQGHLPGPDAASFLPQPGVEPEAAERSEADEDWKILF